MEVLLGVFYGDVPVLCPRFPFQVMCFVVVLVVERVFPAKGAVGTSREVRMGASQCEFILCGLSRRIRVAIRFRALVRRCDYFPRISIVLYRLILICGAASNDVNVERVDLCLFVSVVSKCKDGKDWSNAGGVVRFVKNERVHFFSPAVCGVARPVTILRFEGARYFIGYRSNKRVGVPLSNDVAFLNDGRGGPVHDLASVRDYYQDAFRSASAFRVLQVRVKSAIASIPISNVYDAASYEVDLFDASVRRQRTICSVGELVVAKYKAGPPGARFHEASCAKKVFVCLRSHDLTNGDYCRVGLFRANRFLPFRFLGKVYWEDLFFFGAGDDCGRVIGRRYVFAGLCLGYLSAPCASFCTLMPRGEGLRSHAVQREWSRVSFGIYRDSANSPFLSCHYAGGKFAASVGGASPCY